MTKLGGFLYHRAQLLARDLVSFEALSCMKALDTVLKTARYDNGWWFPLSSRAASSAGSSVFRSFILHEGAGYRTKARAGML
jgi:hypothetical protein